MATSTYPLNGRASLKGKKIGLFIPCYIDLVYPEVGVATLELLEKFGLEVGFPLDQTCCGQPMSNSGDEANSLAAERLFVSNFQDFDYIIGPAGSCGPSMSRRANIAALRRFVNRGTDDYGVAVAAIAFVHS